MAKVTTNRAVKTSCKNTKVRTASGACAPERKPMMKSGGTSPFGILSIIAGVDKNPKATAADRISGAKMSNKKMEVGGTTESCGPGKPKGCGYAKAQRKNSRSQMRSHIGPVVAKVLTTAATIGGLAYGAMKGKKMLENKKSGGTVKKTLPKAQVGTSKGTPYQEYMKNPGATASDTTRIPFDKNSQRVFPKAGSTLDNAHRATYGDDYRVNAERTGRKMPAAGSRGDNKAYYEPLKKGTSLKKLGGATHPGFKAVQSKIAAKQGISKESAGAILASSTRKASVKAKATNPRLKKVK